MADPKNIISAILEESSTKHYSVGKTQLVKLLYLCEVEYYRETERRLTNLDWVFYHFGPYAHELEEVLSDRLYKQDRTETTKGNTFIRYNIAEQAGKYGDSLDPRVSLIVKRIVGAWGNKPLEQLLDYVYFETEPMEAVERRGERLNFTTVKKASVSPVIPLKASRETEERVAVLRERLAPILKKIADQPQPERHEGDEYDEAMKAWDEEMEKNFDTEALKNISVIITRPTDNSPKEGN